MTDPRTGLPKGEIMARVFAAMPGGYDEASDGGAWPAPARQVFYAVRRRSGLGDTLRGPYFLNKLLDLYLDAHPDETAEWDVVRDDRGSFTEPHTFREVPLGTLAVRDYLSRVDAHDRRNNGRPAPPPELDLRWPTWGPTDRFGGILYNEKEGFNGQLRAARTAECFDLAIASGKGYSPRAARRLLAHLHDTYGVPVFVVHDFDKNGIGIFDTLGDGFVDLGLRLADVTDPEWGLEAMAEGVAYEGKDPAGNLQMRGASPEEIDWLLSPPEPGSPFPHRRVELNALVGRAFVDWLEAKLTEHGVAKVVPDEATIEAAYRRAYEREWTNVAIEREWAEAHRRAAAAPVPDELVSRLTDLQIDDEEPWDDDVAAQARRDVAAGLDGDGGEEE